MTFGTPSTRDLLKNFLTVFTLSYYNSCAKSIILIPSENILLQMQLLNFKYSKAYNIVACKPHHIFGF